MGWGNDVLFNLFEMICKSNATPVMVMFFVFAGFCLPSLSFQSLGGKLQCSNEMCFYQ